MPADRRTFDDALESMIYLDSTFVIALMEQSRPFHAECEAFRQRLVAEGILPVVSELVYDEHAFHAIKEDLISASHRLGQPWQDLRRTHPHLVRATMARVETEAADLESFTISLSITPSVRAPALQLMRDFALLPTDAYHIATALDAGVTSFATLDRDFLTVDGITVYTCLP